MPMLSHQFELQIDCDLGFIDQCLTPITPAEESFCFTGIFLHGTRKEVQSMAKELGSSVSDILTAGISYLVVGSKSSKSWKHGNTGNKIQHAIDIKKKGAHIKIITEAVFLRMCSFSRVN